MTKYTHYRIVSDNYSGYEVQFAKRGILGGLKFKERCTNTHRTLEGARVYAAENTLRGSVEEGSFLELAERLSQQRLSNTDSQTEPVKNAKSKKRKG